MEVDHFDPRRKKDLIQQYSNLLLATRHCNNKKGKRWPTKMEAAAGCRFLNPCKEADYGAQIFESPDTHLLIGTTPAARWHIRICALNAEHLVRERGKRAKYSKLLTTQVLVKQNPAKVIELAQALRAEVDLMHGRKTGPRQRVAAAFSRSEKTLAHLIFET